LVEAVGETFAGEVGFGGEADADQGGDFVVEELEEGDFAGAEGGCAVGAIDGDGFGAAGDIDDAHGDDEVVAVDVAAEVLVVGGGMVGGAVGDLVGAGGDPALALEVFVEGGDAGEEVLGGVFELAALELGEGGLDEGAGGGIG
jgi:hypothetical protein